MRLFFSGLRWIADISSEILSYGYFNHKNLLRPTDRNASLN